MRNELQTFPMVVVATTHSNKLLTHDMLECFLHEIEIEVCIVYWLDDQDIYKAFLVPIAQRSIFKKLIICFWLLFDLLVLVIVKSTFVRFFTILRCQREQEQREPKVC